MKEEIEVESPVQRPTTTIIARLKRRRGVKRLPIIPTIRFFLNVHKKIRKHERKLNVP